jgi:flagellin
MHLLAKEEITMAMVVKNNMSAVSTLNTLNKNQSALGTSLAKVSSGQKINTAKDDASGYAISERMRVMVRALDQATQNTQNGSAMMKVAEGAVNNTVEILKTLKEKAINAATDTNTDSDRATLQKEINQFVDQINDNALATFNGKYLVDGSKSAAVGTSTKTILINQMLSSDTASGAFTSMLDSSGKSLNIVDGDKITASVVSQGQVITTTVTVSEATTEMATVLEALNTAAIAKGIGGGGIIDTAASVHTGDSSTIAASDTAGEAVTTPNGEGAFAIVAKTGGINSQISGFTITVTDADGNAKKSANEKLEFTALQFAKSAQTKDNSLKIHVGAAAGQTISVSLLDMRAESLGLQDASAKVLNVSTPEKANAAISAFDFALAKALDMATTIGAIEARLDYTASNLTTSSENVQAAESTIRDADMAKEMTNYTKNNVLLQAAQSMLAQANQNSSAVLSLLQ